MNVAITSSLGTVTRTFNLQIGRPVVTLTATYSSGNIAVPIPDVSSVDIPINVTDVGAVADVNVKVRLNHTFDGDLVLTLIAPDGTSVALANNRGGGGDNFGTGANDCSGVPTVFDDSAADSDRRGHGPVRGIVQARFASIGIQRQGVNGVWILRISDIGAVDVGTVGCVTLEIARQRFACCGVPGTPEIQAAPPVTVTNESCAPRQRRARSGRDRHGQLPAAEHRHGQYHQPGRHAAPRRRRPRAERPADLRSPSVLDGPTVARPFTFTVAGMCGGDLMATLALQDGAMNLGTVTFTIRVGGTVSATSSFSNPTSIIIPATGTGAATGAPSNPYPSTIDVSGITGTVSKVTVDALQLQPHVSQATLTFCSSGREGRNCS